MAYSKARGSRSMKKSLFVILLTIFIQSAGHAEIPGNDFEAELRLLENSEKIITEREEKAEILVEKLSPQVLDSVSTQNFATSRKTSTSEIESAPITQEILPSRKTRRIPSR
jgi:hypothetical protein